VDGTVLVGSNDGILYAVDAGVSGSSEGSRVMLGTLGHHSQWRYAGQEISSQSAKSTSSGDVPWLPLGAGVLASVTGVAAWRLRSGDDEDDATAGSPGKSDSKSPEDDSGHQEPTTAEPTDTPEINIDDRLDDADSHLESVRRARKSGDYDRALTACSLASNAIDDAVEAASEHAPERTAEIESRREEFASLREEIEAEREAHERVSYTLDWVANTVEEDQTPSLDRLETDARRLDDIAPLIEDYDFDDAASRQTALRDRIETLQEQAEDAQNRTPIPDPIPTTPRYSLAYDAFEKGDPLGSGGNADVYYATAETDDGQVELAIKEPRMSGTLHTETVDRMLEEAETWQRLDDHDHIVS